MLLSAAGAVPPAASRPPEELRVGALALFEANFAWFSSEFILGAGLTAVALLDESDDGLETSTGLKTVAAELIEDIPPISIVLPPQENRPSPNRLSAHAVWTLEQFVKNPRLPPRSRLAMPPSVSVDIARGAPGLDRIVVCAKIWRRRAPFL
jgi:hypothetical protein